MTNRRHPEEPDTVGPHSAEALDYTADNTFTVSNPLKESVAAHQAECGCHPILVPNLGLAQMMKDGKATWEDMDTPVCCDRGPDGPQDSSGTRWHVDPLCKVRPEARR